MERNILDLKLDEAQEQRMKDGYAKHRNFSYYLPLEDLFYELGCEIVDGTNWERILSKVGGYGELALPLGSRIQLWLLRRMLSLAFRFVQRARALWLKTQGGTP